MELRKAGVIIIFILILIGGLWFLGDKMTGNLVWEPVVESNCTNAIIENLWDDVFEESSSGINIHRSFSGGTCADVFAIKGDGVSKVYCLMPRLNGFSAYFISVNSSSDYNRIMESETSAEANMNFGISMAGRGALINNVSMQGSSEAVSYFNSIINENIDSLEAGTDPNKMPHYIYYKEGVEEGCNYIFDYMVGNNKTFIYIYNNVTCSALIKNNNIPNFTLEKNTGWNNVFDIPDYFIDYEGIIFNIEALGTNNTNGEWINYTISNNEVNFKPANNFTGSREFRVGGSGVYSNNFTVNIINNTNRPPVLKKQFDYIDVPRSGTKIVYLDVYFEDPDGDNMTFSVGGNTSNLNISITRDVMYMGLKGSFNGSAEIWVMANDSKNETKSNKFWVFEEINLIYNATLGNNTAINNTNNTNLIGDVGGSDSSTVTSSSNNSNNNKKASGDFNFKIFFWIGLVFCVLALILFIIWFFILRKGDEFGSGSPENTQNTSAPVAPINPVNEYLKKINTTGGN